MTSLQLIDYKDGYRFRVKCSGCGYGWYAEPKELLEHFETHERMYLDEVAKVLWCKSCYTSQAIITPIIIMPTHHFVGGMA